MTRRLTERTERYKNEAQFKNRSNLLFRVLPRLDGAFLSRDGGMTATSFLCTTRTGLLGLLAWACPGPVFGTGGAEVLTAVLRSLLPMCVPEEDLPTEDLSEANEDMLSLGTGQ